MFFLHCMMNILRQMMEKTLAKPLIEKVYGMSSLTTRYQDVCIFWWDMFFKNINNILTLLSHSVSTNFLFWIYIFFPQACFLFTYQFNHYSISAYQLQHRCLLTSSLLINDLPFFQALNILTDFILFTSFKLFLVVLWMLWNLIIAFTIKDIYNFYYIRYINK